MKRLPLSLYASGLLAAGCMVGPNYQQPEAQTPSIYRHATATAPASPATQPENSSVSASVVQPEAKPLDAWWKTLDDSVLNSLVEQSIESNLDLQVAEARIREARAFRQMLSADLWPQIGSRGSHVYRGGSLNTRGKTTGPGFKNTVLSGVVGNLGSAAAGAVTGTGAFLGTGAPPLNQAASTAIRQGVGRLQSKLTQSSVSRDINLFQAGFDASWELDLFGGTRRAIEASEAQIQAAEEDLHDLQTTLVSEVARNYVEARNNQKRLSIARDNVKLQQDTLELTRVKFRAGLTAELDVAQAAAQLATTESQVPRFESLWYQSIHRIAVLLGKEPEALEDELQRNDPIPSVPPAVPVGLPSELLLRRADLRRAERLLAAATAEIGVAVADLYPRFSITGSFGADTRDFRHILDYNSFAWSVGPAVRWPIFDAGRIRANIEMQNARQVQALLQYRNTILIALEEVEDALVAYRQEQQRYVELDRAVKANRRAVELASDRYRKGLTSFLDLLQAQGSLYLTQDQLVQSEATVVENFIALNKALGGGWQITPERAKPSTSVITAADTSPALSLIVKPPKTEQVGLNH